MLVGNRPRVLTNYRQSRTGYENVSRQLPTLFFLDNISDKIFRSDFAWQDRKTQQKKAIPKDTTYVTKSSAGQAQTCTHKP